MIRLNVKEYCNNCPEFEAQTNKVYYTYKVEPEIHTTVTCKNMEKCERIKERLACNNNSLLAEWVYEHDGIPCVPHCSNCRNTPLWNGADYYEFTNFCPYCGARMTVDDAIKKYLV